MCAQITCETESIGLSRNEDRLEESGGFFVADPFDLGYRAAKGKRPAENPFDEFRQWHDFHEWEKGYETAEWELAEGQGVRDLRF